MIMPSGGPRPFAPAIIQATLAGQAAAQQRRQMEKQQELDTIYKTYGEDPVGRAAALRAGGYFKELRDQAELDFLQFNAERTQLEFLRDNTHDQADWDFLREMLIRKDTTGSLAEKLPVDYDPKFLKGEVSSYVDGIEQFKRVVGTDPETGAPILREFTFGKQKGGGLVPLAESPEFTERGERSLELDRERLEETKRANRARESLKEEEANAKGGTPSFTNAIARLAGLFFEAKVDPFGTISFDKEVDQAQRARVQSTISLAERIGVEEDVGPATAFELALRQTGVRAPRFGPSGGGQRRSAPPPPPPPAPTGGLMSVPPEPATTSNPSDRFGLFPGR